MGWLSDAEVAAWTERTCREQGVEVSVTDPDTLGQISVLLGGPGRDAAEGRAADRAA